MAIKKIAIRKLQVGMSIANPIYEEKDGKRLLLMSDNTLIVSDSQTRRLLDAGITSVEIDTDKGIDTFQSLLNQKKWAEVIKTAKDGGATESLISKHIDTFATTFTGIITKNITSRLLIGENRVTLVLREILQKIQNNIDVMMALLRLKAINEYTYSHSINVSVLCISLANQLGFNFADITRFGTGTLLADLGMTNYPPGLIRRPSGLSKKEMGEIQKHPIYTVEFLKNNGIDDSLIEKIVIQHHERFDGTGYPNGLKGDEIHSISKLFSIADVYVAMTSHRPQRLGIPPHMVLSDILKMSGTLYDPKMSTFFIKHIGVFPVGNMVELTGGHLALVASPNKSYPLKPVVVLFQTKKKLKTSKKTITGNDIEFTISRGQWKLVDLAKEGEEYGKIKRGIDHRQYNISPNFYLDKV